jgi:hypothetical protein
VRDDAVTRPHRGALYLHVPLDPRSVMVFSGLALKVFGSAVKFVAMAVAPVVGVLVWGAVEDGMDKRKDKNKDAGRSS